MSDKKELITINQLIITRLHGDLFSQMTRNDASLVADRSSSSKSSNSVDVASSIGLLSFAKGDDFPPGSFREAVNSVSSSESRTTSDKSFSLFVVLDDALRATRTDICEDIAGSCSTYYLNTAKFYWITVAYRVVGVINTVEYDVFVWLLLVVVLYGIYWFDLTPKFLLLGRSISNSPLPYPPVCSTANPTPSPEGDNPEYFTSREDVGLGQWFAKRTLFATPLLTVAVLFTFTNCGMFSSGGKKGDAPWLLLAGGVNGHTSSVDDASNGSASGGGSGSGGSALVPVVGMYFLHPDHLGSITMITDGRGNVISGGNNGGKSHISYTPYGSIHRTDSSGPDITRFKYTGQEEDKESGLLYYKARYYDPMLGRFLQADSMAFPDRVMGMNRYMYVEGNPVRFTDNTGNSTNYGHMLGQIGNHMPNGVAWAAKGIKGGAEWASKGLENAGKTYSNAIYGQHHNEKALTHGSAFANSAVRGLRIGFALCFPILSFIFDPAFTLGVWFTAANLIVGNLLGYGTSVHYAHGGYVIKNAPFVFPTAGITLGPFASTGIRASKMTEEHEKGHIDQYHDWGGHEYMGRFGGSLWGQGSSWGENNADSRANTWAYDREYIYLALASMAARNGDRSLLLAYFYWSNSSSWSKTY